MKKILSICLSVILLAVQKNSTAQGTGMSLPEKYRPQFHFSPREHWMNDPNGLVYDQGIYHLFYQHYPGGTKWGPMHWGHATSKDLINWENMPVALYPDSLGYIFSGSAVVDINNTSGFGKKGQVALVAVFTHHNKEKEQDKKSDFQNQSIAYSLDHGKTWTKYGGNPVLKNPGITDFRDPKVRWYAPQKKWVMTLATKDRVSFYSSPDLKNWKRESDFGNNLGAHGGVWECPDLFPLTNKGKEVWVLLVSINPGGPNSGSATQYFIGDFNGTRFTPYDTLTRWMDHGADNYAGVTYANTGNRTIMIGWMSNWQYAQLVPTKAWRSAMTIPREFSLKEVNSKLLLVSKPVKELDLLNERSYIIPYARVKGAYHLSDKLKTESTLSKLELTTEGLNDFSILLTNAAGNEVIIGYDKQQNRYYIDRSRSGETGFEPGFGHMHFAPRIGIGKNISITLIADAASVELFADHGLTVMTDIFFPSQPMRSYTIQSANGITIRQIRYTELKAAALPGILSPITEQKMSSSMPD